MFLIRFHPIAPLLAGFLLNGFTDCSGQAQAIRFPSEMDNKLLLELHYTPTRKPQLPVYDIEVIDARFNQSHIGISTGTEMLVTNAFSRQDVIFPSKLSIYLSLKFKDWFDYDATSADKLVLLVKKFRTSENIRKMLLTSQRKEVFLLLSISFFLQRGDVCYRIGTMDKWYSSDIVKSNPYTIKRNTHEWLITNVLLQEINQLNFTIHEHTGSFLRSEVEAAVQRRFDMPAFRQRPQKGIYRHFREFLNNQPADTAYRIATGKSGKIYFLDKNGQVLTSAQAWGLSDGVKTVYLFGNNFYELDYGENYFRVKTHRKTGIKKTVSIIRDLQALGLINKRAKKFFAYSDMPDYLDVDMDTGELFLEELLGLYKTSTLTEAVRKF
jgi:hypothetical protein